MDEDDWIERLLREVDDREDCARPEDELPDDLPRWEDDEEGWD